MPYGLEGLVEVGAELGLETEIADHRHEFAALLEIDAAVGALVVVLPDGAAELVDPRGGLAVGPAVEAAVEFLDVEVGIPVEPGHAPTFVGHAKVFTGTGTFRIVAEETDVALGLKVKPMNLGAGLHDETQSPVIVEQQVGRVPDPVLIDLPPVLVGGSEDGFALRLPDVRAELRHDGLVHLNRRIRRGHEVGKRAGHESGPFLLNAVVQLVEVAVEPRAVEGSIVGLR